MSRSCSIRLALSVSLVLACIGALQAAQPMAIPFAETFSQPALDSTWQADVSPGNRIEVKDGALQIRAKQNTYAHIQRPLGVDFIRAACEIKPASSITWCTSLFVYWDSGNWCQMGIIDRDGGRYYVLEMIDNQAHEYDLGKCVFDGWHHVVIELGVDYIRYSSSEDGKAFRIEATHRRPPQFARIPQLLAVGKGHSGPAGHTGSDLNNDYATPGEFGTSQVRDVRVAVLPWEHLRATAEEQAAWETAGLDLPGEKELAGPDDPSFESVIRYYPAMKHPREVVGVKDHPHDIGVAPDGSLQLSDDINRPDSPVAFFEVGEPVYRFGSGTQPCRKRLHNGWMPIVVAADEHEGLKLEQTVFGWTEKLSADEPLYGCVRLKVTNTADAARPIKLRLRVKPASDKCPPREWAIDIPARGESTVEAAVPFLTKESPIRELSSAELDQRLRSVVEYWSKLIEPGTRFVVPEQRVQDAYRAWLAYNFLNVDKRDGVYHICDGAGFYEQVYGYSAALYCYALDLMGYHDQARTYLDSILTVQQPDGLICVNFGATDTGAMLWVMGEHYRLTNDAEWLKRNARKMTAMCNWIIEHRKESMKHIHGKRAMVHGLVRWRPYCDFELAAFDYFCNGYLCMGMKAASQVFAEIGLTDESARLGREAGAFHKDILTSMDAAIISHDGMKMLPLMPDTQFLLKETGYTANGYYGLLASCLLETGIPAFDDARADLVVDMLRQKGGLQVGVCSFFDMIDHAYTWGYWDVCLKRDEPKRAILGLHGSMAYGMSRDTYAAVECTAIRTGENMATLPHTYSNTVQLRLLRNMLLRESGDDLLIGFAVPRPWLAPGKRLAVRMAPTLFGPVSFSMETAADGSTIRFRFEPPARGMKGAVKTRLRHPALKDIKAVQVDPQTDLTFQQDVIELRRPSRSIDLVVRY